MRALKRLSFHLLQILVFVLISLISSGQPIIQQTISPNPVGMDSYTILRITIATDGHIEQVYPPDLPAFSIISGPYQENSSITIDGKTKKAITVLLTLKPLITGTFRIGRSRIIIDNKPYWSNPSKIIIKPEHGGNNTSSETLISKGQSRNLDNIYTAENMQEKISRNMKLKLITSKQSCYVGEPIVATYNLYTRLKSDSRLTGNPAFNGFSVIDLKLPEPEHFETVYLNGEPFHVYPIRKVILFPLLPGLISLESAELENKVQFIQPDYLQQNHGLENEIMDAFSNETLPESAIRTETVLLKNPSATILVKPLPENGQPLNFRGAVGQYSMNTYLEKNEIALNETAILTVRITGTGNIALLNAPVIEWPEQFELFEPTIKDSIDANSFPLMGFKIFTYRFSVKNTGKYQLPVIRFSFFNPEKVVYDSLQASNLSIQVKKASAPTSPAINKDETINEASGINRIFSNRWWIIAFISCCFFLVIITLIYKSKKSINKEQQTLMNEETNIMNAHEKSSSFLASAEQIIHDSDSRIFYSRLQTGIYELIAWTFHYNKEFLNIVKVEEILTENKISQKQIENICYLLKETERFRYSPDEGNEQKDNIWKLAKEFENSLVNHHS